jgi:hypothetical protein
MTEEIAEAEVVAIEAAPVDEKPKPKTREDKGAMVETVADAQKAYARSTELKLEAAALFKQRLQEEATALEQLKAARLSLLKETEGAL